MVNMNLEMIILASTLASVSPELVKSVVHVESSGQNTIRFHDGNSPSYGVGQVKMNTARFLAKKYKFKFHASDLLRPATNIKYVAFYLKHQLSRYKGNVSCAVEAYNKGTAQKCSGRYVNSVMKGLNRATRH